LDDYADRFSVPVHLEQTVNSITARPGMGFTVTATTASGEHTWSALKVVVATGGNTEPVIPPNASELHPQITQLHTGQYRRPDDLPGDRVLVVGSGASGVQLGVELAQAGRQVTVAGKPTPSIPAPLLAIAGVAWFSL